MRIDREKAEKILETEVSSKAQVPDYWAGLVSQLSNECERGANKTFIAMLGTALLARATNLLADPFALKSGLTTPGAYSARSLCQHVLAAHAPRLGIDLGVTGREPLNNQPFFAEDRVHDGMPVHTRAEAGFRILLEGLDQISQLSSESDARAALRAFLHGRLEQRYQGQLELDADEDLAALDLVSAIEGFVRTASEYGRRAQAAVAGILDTVSSSDVTVSHIHDPDRHFPGDVNVSNDGHIRIALEVRDKPVTEPDAYHFIRKVSSSAVPKAGVVAIGGGTMEYLDASTLNEFAQRHNVTLQIFPSWTEFVLAATFWADVVPNWTNALKHIHRRAIELEVSASGTQQWEAIAAKITEAV